MSGTTDQTPFHAPDTQIIETLPQMVWVLNPDGWCDYVNYRWCDFTGLSFAESLGHGWSVALHPEEAEDVGRTWREVLEQGVAYSAPVQFRRADGAFRCHLTQCVPMRDAGGQITSWIGTCTDIEEQRQAGQALESAYRREALLNRIGEALRGTLDPDEIQSRASDALGHALAVDRCFFSFYDLAEGLATIVRDWHRADLFPLAGEYRLSDFAPNAEDYFPGGRTLVVEDLQAGGFPASLVANYTRLRVRSGIRVPLFAGNHLVATLTAAMSDGPRVWTPEEVTLVEAVAAQARSAVEAARVRHREHTIATVLQRALQPETNPKIPGVEVASFYRPALSEASIGGDFYDVFPLSESCHALVIGDVSGKGLAAATQVATVRNMLRCLLYQYAASAQAVTELNRLLTTHDLLRGIVTLFVGVYDTQSRLLEWVSGGHEPGLWRRASDGGTTPLVPTGPPLGADVHAVYDAGQFVFSPGDLLLLSTDGLSEAGPTRRDLLGTEGLTRLLDEGARTGGQNAQTLAERLVAGVETHSDGPLRDDACLLLVRCV